MLRRSPRRTAALLAANRANAQKSTGPRTKLGKQRSAANAFWIGDRASAAFWMRTLSHRELAEFLALRDTLDAALLDQSEGRRLSTAAANLVWTMKRIWERELRRLPLEERRRMSEGLLPPARAWHRTIRCSLPGADEGSTSGESPVPDLSSPPYWNSVPGRERFGTWKVTITLLMRRGRRGLGSESRSAARVAHVITKITCTGHPLLDCGCVPVALSTKPAAQTKPECNSEEGDYENISALCNCSRSPAEAPVIQGASEG